MLPILRFPSSDISVPRSLPRRPSSTRSVTDTSACTLPFCPLFLSHSFSHWSSQRTSANSHPANARRVLRRRTGRAKRTRDTPQTRLPLALAHLALPSDAQRCAEVIKHSGGVSRRQLPSFAFPLAPQLESCPAAISVLISPPRQAADLRYIGAAICGTEAAGSPRPPTPSSPPPPVPVAHELSPRKICGDSRKTFLAHTESQYFLGSTHAVSSSCQLVLTALGLSGSEHDAICALSRPIETSGLRWRVCCRVMTKCVFTAFSPVRARPSPSPSPERRHPQASLSCLRHTDQPIPGSLSPRRV
ncbi:hypothetical protein BC628DRAFT_188665 [Trametes gibbosa]|nr:hypothetical protein BC628DRAFT_188665 [Trametes gibbosa]